MKWEFGQEIIDKIRKKKPKRQMIVVFPDFYKTISGEIILERIKPKIDRLKSNLDENSIRVIDESVNKLVDSMTCKSDPRMFLSKEQIENDKQFQKELAEIKPKYPLATDHYMPEVFFYHHGLRFASSKIKDYIKQKDIFDIGAYVGDSAIILKEYTSKKVYSFEFSSRNISLFEKTMVLNNVSKDEITLVPMAISKEEGVLKVNDCGGGALSIDEDISCSFMPDKGNEIEVNMTSIDKFVDKNGLSMGFLKIDVEGVALDVIKGAVNSIKKNRPVISIGIYHNTSEFFDVKPFMEEMIPDYVFEFQTMNFSPLFLSELTLFAYPKELSGN